MTRPTDLPRRSFVHRQLTTAGARFAPIGDGAVAVDFGDPAGEAAAARRLGLADLSPLPRCGFKGPGTVEWLMARGLVVPPDSNRAARQPGGEIAARLALSEVLILGALDGDGTLPARLEAAWPAGTASPAEPRGFPVPRRDSHAWFLVTGSDAPAMFARLCGVDLRPHRFSVGTVAQTSVARLAAILIQDERDGIPAYHLLADSAAAGYLLDCVREAMAEFDGRLVGLASIRAALA